MFMLDFCNNAGIGFTVCHFQHGIRDNDYLDKELIQQFIQDKQIQCNVVVGYGKDLKDSSNLEAEARSQRWEFVRNYRKTLGKEVVAVTAHHLNDNIEQVFLDLMRGAAHSNLGLAKFRFDESLEFFKCKPFLTVPKSVILEQCNRRGIPFIDDITNQDNHHERNWLRNEIIPQLMSRRNLEKSMLNALIHNY